MTQWIQPKEFVSALITELESLPSRATAPMRTVRRRYSKELRSEEAPYVFEVAQIILDSGKHRWIAYELIHDHPDAFHTLDRLKLEALGQGISSWSSVDSFARTLSGPAWRDGLISISTIQEWAKSEDRWWRRAALVSTVGLNVRSRGGKGDVKQTLAICRMLVRDHDDMIVKALSWALRELVVHDSRVVEEFIRCHRNELAKLVIREVMNKIKTGFKNP